MKNEWVKSIFTDTVTNAIFKRKQEINTTVIILSKLLEAYGMGMHRKTVERLILSREVDDAFAEEHVIFDFIHGDLWLDLEALQFHGDILEGFIEKDEYREYIEIVKGEENIRKIQNQALQLFQGKSIAGLIKTIWKEGRHKAMFPDEVAMIKRWCLLELFARTRIPRIYYYIKGLPMKIRINYTGNRLKRSVMADMKQ